MHSTTVNVLQDILMTQHAAVMTASIFSRDKVPSWQVHLHLSILNGICWGDCLQHVSLAPIVHRLNVEVVCCPEQVPKFCSARAANLQRV
jgi:hypothetical protein